MKLPQPLLEGTFYMTPVNKKIILLEISTLLFLTFFEHTSPAVFCSGVVSLFGESWV